MTATLQQIESSSRLLGDEVEAWLKQITPISSPANPLSASPVSAPAAEHGFDIKALVAAGVAEVERSQKATATAQQLARPGLLARITRRHLRPADRGPRTACTSAAPPPNSPPADGAAASFATPAGQHCILGALLAVPSDNDTALRSHIHIRAAMTTPAYAQPSDAYIERLEQEARRQSLDAAAVRRAHEIAVHNNTALRIAARINSTRADLRQLCV
ncbi:hypothetical protein AR457_34465 [Streptomyces agglomeratus]|uniref:hypothetical protein n=1 Tax=Streptomyces agglomeratus TaxID=285458 RepID=UPI000854B630|nr:hypothetical protein [Streptomyces agglomeratus]OEJ48472.1 hypothetical protein AR457_34465 [Streptomyces agglomeratus]